MMEEREFNAEVILRPGQSLEAINRAEVDIQINTAKKFPLHSTARDIERFRSDAISLATLDQETAESCLFAVPREGRLIHGPSVRLAEIIVSTYGNLRAGARIVEIGDREVVAQGVCHDLERNVYQTTEVRRRIIGKTGRRYNDDMITLTCNAACSIAFRNAVFKVIPAALCKPIYNAARTAATGDIKSIEIRRARAFQKFELMGISKDRVLARLGIPSIADMDADKLQELVGLYNAIESDELSIDTAFPNIGEKPPLADPKVFEEGLTPTETEVKWSLPRPNLPVDPPKRRGRKPDTVPVETAPSDDIPWDGVGPQEISQKPPEAPESKPIPAGASPQVIRIYCTEVPPMEIANELRQWGLKPSATMTTWTGPYNIGAEGMANQSQGEPWFEKVVMG